MAAPLPPIAEAVLADLAAVLAGRPLPRVRALHLPPSPWNGSKAGEFGALELDDGSLGLCYVLDEGRVVIPADSGSLAGTDAFALAHEWAGGDAAWRALGFAAVNALTRHVFDAAGFVPPAASDAIGGIDPQPGDHVGMVGHFPPLVKEVTARGARLTVVERRPQLAGEHGDHRVTLDASALAGCNKVLCTSTVLLNDTFDAVLANCRGARVLAMIGPGASCLPDALFARGVTLMGGVWVDDRERLVDALAAGSPWGRFTHKFALPRAAYPGWAALRARL